MGTLGEDGRVHNLRTKLVVTPAFIVEANKLGPPEARMRFAASCQEGECAQWTGSRCGIIEKVLDHLDAEVVGEDAVLQPCTIRAACRWFDQRGAPACNACALVVTDQSTASAA